MADMRPKASDDRSINALEVPNKQLSYPGTKVLYSSSVSSEWRVSSIIVSYQGNWN